MYLSLGSVVYFSVKKIPDDRQSAHELMVCIIPVSIFYLYSQCRTNKVGCVRSYDIPNLMAFYCCQTQTHPFINMYEDLDIDLKSYFTSAGSPLATL